jgi:CTP synthase (UTP-ammonia lyase)
MPLERIYVIVCYGMSDIGKGWLTASIGAIQPEGCVPVKIDPLLYRLGLIGHGFV